MTRCLMLAAYPFNDPRHGGQVRAAGFARSLSESGWQVRTVGIYPDAFFPTDQRGPDDIVLTGPEIRDAALGDVLFADLIVAQHAARSPDAVAALRAVLERLQPDIVHIEQPWPWLLLNEALKTLPNPAIVYSSQNIEWRMRPEMYRLGLRRAGADRLVAETRALEMALWRRAELILSISDVEGAEIARESGRDDVAYVPPVSDIADRPAPADGRFGTEAEAAGVRYAALLSSAYWPNNEGFQEMFADGLGFLRTNEQIWVGGQLGSAIADDVRYQDYLTINETRMRRMGYVADDDKAGFFAASRCVLVPVRMGAGAKLKTADALASGRPVISTSHGIEGYGPLVSGALDNGVYVCDAPADFRRMITRALREGLPGCDDSLREAVRRRRLTETVAPLYARLRRKHLAARMPLAKA